MVTSMVVCTGVRICWDMTFDEKGLCGLTSLGGRIWMAFGPKD